MDTVISFIAQDLYLIVVVVALVYLLAFYRERWLKLAIAALIIGVVSYLLSKAGTNLIIDRRPFQEDGLPALIPSATDNGFPSDHTLFVACIAAVVTLVDKRIGLVIWILALIIGLARVYARVHHLLDVVGSLLIVLLALAFYQLVFMAFTNWQRNRMERTNQKN